MNKHYTLEQVAQELGMSVNTVRQYVFYGRIKATKQRKNRMVSQEELDRLKTENSA